MVKIPTYFRGKLASEQTGVNTPDRSGEMMAKAVGGAADAFFQITVKAVAERKAVLDKVEVSNALTKYQTDYIKQSKAISDDPNFNPEEKEAKLNDLSSSLKESALDGVSGSSVKEAIRGTLSMADNQTKVENAVGRVDNENLQARNDLYTAVEDLAVTAGETTQLNDYQKVMSSLEEKRAAVLPLVGFDQKKADTFMNNARAQATTRFAYNLIENGEATTAWGYAEGGMFEDSGLEGQAKLTFKNNLRNALKGEQTRNNLRTAVTVLEANSALTEEMELEGVSLVGLQERELNIGFELSQGGLTPEQEKAKQTELKVIGAFIDREVTATSVIAIDGDAKENLYARLGALTTKVDGEKQRYMNQLLEVADDAADAYGADNGISAKTYRKIIGKVSKEIMTEFELGETLEKTWGGAGGVKGTFVRKEGRKAFREMYKEMEKVSGFSNAWVMNTYDAYLDIKDRYGDEIPNKAMKAVQAEALRKGWLKTHGFDELLETGDAVDTPLGPQNISSFTTGKPNLATEDLTFDDMQMIGN